ncbi:MAG TPA: nucleotidyltransferase domain-containing protein [Vicinamibacterales bacterium]|nr:nucleotidyltransferase domain-containing protein [Vicinamibacterales bacterium]
MRATRRTTLPHETPAPLRAALEAASKTWSELLGPRLISMVLFGSVARGDARESSDIDLLVVADRLPRSLTERARPLRQAWEQVRIESGLPPVEWNLVVKTPDEATHHSPLYLDIVEDGILLVDRDGFFEAVLDTMRGRMRALGSRRVYLPDGSWYWDLKPDYRFGEVVEI